jgi:hypothetical protein
MSGRRLKACVENPTLTVAVILVWADAHHGRIGRWPSCESGPVHGAQGETWGRLDAALREGARGLPGGSSLARLLDEHRRDAPRDAGPDSPNGLPPWQLTPACRDAVRALVALA